MDLLVSNNLIHSIPDIFRLTQEALLPLKKSGEVWAGNLITAIAERRTADLWRCIHGLGIPQVGAAAAKDLAANSRSLDVLLGAGERDLLGIEGIGEKTARAIIDWCAAEPHRGRAIFSQQGSPPLRPRAQSSASIAPFSGKTFVLTGTLPTLTREEATALIETAGGRE